MKKYRIITNGEYFRVQYRWLFLWIDATETKGISIGGQFSMINSKVESTTLEESLAWIRNERAAEKPWRVAHSKLARKLSLNAESREDKPDSTSFHTELFRICSHCNKEFQLKLFRNAVDGGGHGHNFSNCPHCGKRNDVWIRLTIKQNTINTSS